MSEARIVTAVTRFKGSPGREREAAEAWAFELTYYFLRGIGEQPKVEYADGVYICTGLMTTTHPGDKSPVTVFEAIAEPWSLDFSVDAARRERLREWYQDREVYWDGRDRDPVRPARSPR